jgi:hypothetical protein
LHVSFTIQLTLVRPFSELFVASCEPWRIPGDTFWDNRDEEVGLSIDAGPCSAKPPLFTFGDGKSTLLSSSLENIR